MLIINSTEGDKIIIEKKLFEKDSKKVGDVELLNLRTIRTSSWFFQTFSILNIVLKTHFHYIFDAFGKVQEFISWNFYVGKEKT